MNIPACLNGHDWWHAEGVIRNLVCLRCGAALHNIAPVQHPPHKVGLPVRPCSPRA